MMFVYGAMASENEKVNVVMKTWKFDLDVEHEVLSSQPLAKVTRKEKQPQILVE
jgi:hypothetical protein